MSRDILLSLIDVDPNNARKHFDDATIGELAQSIKANGLAVPILLRPVADRFTIVHGERRYRAVASLGWATILAEVRELDADSASWLALVENVQRADLSPIEEAQAYRGKLSTGITQSELGARIGKSQSYIATKSRLLKLPEFVQAGIMFGTISEGHAKQLLRLACPEVQCFFTSIIVHDKLTVSQVNERVNRLLTEVSEEMTRYAEAMAFEQALATEPDESPLVKRYGRSTKKGWVSPPNLHFEDWFYGFKQLATIFKVHSIIKAEDHLFLDN